MIRFILNLICRFRWIAVSILTKIRHLPESAKNKSKVENKIHNKWTPPKSRLRGNVTDKHRSRMPAKVRSRKTAKINNNRSTNNKALSFRSCHRLIAVISWIRWARGPIFRFWVLSRTTSKITTWLTPNLSKSKWRKSTIGCVLCQSRRTGWNISYEKRRGFNWMESKSRCR